MYVEVSDVNRSVGLPFRVHNLLGTSAKVEKSLGQKVLTPIMYLSPWKSLQRLVIGGHNKWLAGQFTPLGHKLCNAIALSGRRGRKGRRGGRVNLTSAMRVLHEKVRMFNACEFACSCSKICLAQTAGKLSYTDLHIFEALKTLLFLDDREAFYEDLVTEVGVLSKKVQRGFTKAGVKYAPDEVALHIRLNGGSDLDWYSEDSSPIAVFERSGSDVQFFDYTKDYYRMGEYLTPIATDFPVNYHLTYSAGSRDEWTADIMRQGGNVAVVFREFPTELIGTKTHGGYTFIDGTVHDARALDPYRSIVCLSPLGWPAKKDKTSKFMFDNGKAFLDRVGSLLQGGSFPILNREHSLGVV